MNRFIRELCEIKDKSELKTKDFGEVTTGVDLIDKQLALLPKDVILDLDKTVLDPCTGDGRYLMRYLYHRLQAITSASDILRALRSLHGCDIQENNVLQARKNLIALAIKICEHKNIEPPYIPIVCIVHGNIQQRDFIA